MLAANAWIVSSSNLVRGWSGLGVIKSNGKWCNDPGPGPDGISESSPRPSPLRLVTIYGSSRV